MFNEMMPMSLGGGESGIKFVFASNSYSGAGQGTWITTYSEKDGNNYEKFTKTYYSTGDILDNDYVTITIPSYGVAKIIAKSDCCYIDTTGTLQQITAGNEVTINNGATGGWLVFC